MPQPCAENNYSPSDILYRKVRHSGHSVFMYVYCYANGSVRILCKFQQNNIHFYFLLKVLYINLCLHKPEWVSRDLSLYNCTVEFFGVSQDFFNSNVAC